MHLGVGQQHGELRARQAEEGRAACAQRLAVGQAFERAVEEAGGLELGHQLAELGEPRLAAALVERERAAWLRLCASTSAATSSASSASSALRSVGVSAPLVDERLQRDLEVHLVVRHVDAGRVVDRVGVDAAARERVLDAAALREAEVAALGDDAARAARSALTRTASLALSPTSAWVSLCAFT